MRRSSWIILAFVAAVPLRAQEAPQYRFPPGDTLRYRETSTGSMELFAPQGVIPLEVAHDALIGIVSGNRDTVFAWYDSLAISTSSAQGVNAPAMRGVLGRRFVLRVSPRGAVRTLRAPDFPAAFEGVSDLRSQFFDFFLPLPDAPLAPGLAWTDSVSHRDSTSGGRHSIMTRQGAYRVVGDTVIGGHAAVVVESVVRQSLLSWGPTQGVTATSDLSGEERGFLYWDSIRGRLLARSRSALLEGMVVIEGPAKTEMIQRLEYRSALTLVE